jgi:hypothetical protein
MNFLSKEHDDDLLLRIRSELVAKELLGREADELEQIKKLTGE